MIFYLSELVEFYYFWKKTPGAANNRPRGRRHRPNVLRRIKPGKTGSVAAGVAGNGLVSKDKEFKTKRDADDPSSMSEAEESDANGEDGEPSPYYCRHCFTTDSKDWHHAGNNSIKTSLLVNLLTFFYWSSSVQEPQKIMSSISASNYILSELHQQEKKRFWFVRTVDNTSSVTASFLVSSHQVNTLPRQTLVRTKKS